MRVDAPMFGYDKNHGKQKVIYTYKVSCACSNCGYVGVTPLPKGTKRTEREQECPRCKCECLMLMPLRMNTP